jgi:CubicO group peptidase (beta-lactamase class C family)
MKRIIFSLVLCLFVFSVSADDKFPVKETLEPYVKNGDLAGIVTVIADKDKILQLNTLGYADLEQKRPITEDSLFWIASQSKPVTAVAAMILVDEGKLNLDDPVTKYLPELKDLKVIKEQNEKETILVPVDKPITLRHVLSHTSGMVYLPILQAKNKIDILPFSQALYTCAMTPLKAQPGTAHIYSNMGVDIAATVVERVSGLPFETFLEQRLFEPLGMKDTTFFPTTEQLQRLVIAYTQDKDTGKLIPERIGQLSYPLDNRPARYAEAGGGLFSTPKNLVRFYQMLQGKGEFQGKRILKPESVEEIAKKQTGDLPNGYGLCTATGGGSFGHGGAYGTESKVDTKTGLVLLYIVQEVRLPKAGEARSAFFQAVKSKSSGVGVIDTSKQ